MLLVLLAGPDAAARIAANELASVRDLEGNTWYFEIEDGKGAFHKEGESHPNWTRQADDPDLKLINTGVQHVSVFDISKEYGGPEEGGWWYTRRVLRFAVPVAAGDGSRIVLGKLTELFADDDDGRSLSSVLSCGQTRVELHDWPVENVNESRPHYE